MSGIGKEIEKHMRAESTPVATVLRLKLIDVARELRKWAAQSRNGGGSTELVDPMRRLADQIDEVIEG